MERLLAGSQPRKVVNGGKLASGSKRNVVAADIWHFALFRYLAV